MDVILRYVDANTKYYAARVLAMLHDTPDVGVVDNVCLVVQWFEEATVRSTNRDCRLIARGGGTLRYLKPSEEVSVQPHTDVVAVAHIFASPSDAALGISDGGSDDRTQVYIRDCAYEHLQGFYE